MIKQSIIFRNITLKKLDRIAKIQYLSQDELEQIAKMNNLPQYKLEQISKTRRTKNYKNMLKEDLLIALLKSN